MEELIGEEHQQRGHCFKQDAIGDVTTRKDACKLMQINYNLLYYNITGRNVCIIRQCFNLLIRKVNR